jgi:hypothetical protein
MVKKSNKKPLYRKVNTKARGVHHLIGADFRNSRHSLNTKGTKMVRGKQRGLDYTPLFKFLLSKIDEKWDTVHSEAVSRLDNQEPITWLVATSQDLARDYVLIGESSYFSGLFVDDNGILKVSAPEIDCTSIKPSCSCCTHTFNGVLFTQKFGDK